ncbi:MAG: hypothetical protein QQN63_09560 [Nitrosopumilus sp.]
MKVDIAFNTDEVREISFQKKFPHITDCCRCDGKARLGFIAHETDEPKGARYVSHIWDNADQKKEGLWLHDACVVAVYFCRKCLEPTALYNQA